MTGLLTLSQGVLCTEAALGQVFHACIADIPVEIFFPLPPDTEEKEESSPFGNPLQPPSIAKTWKRGNDPFNWGYPMQLPSGNSHVNLLALSIECDESQIEETAKALYSSIEKWERSFVDLLIISTKQSTERDKNIPRENTCELELLGDKYIPSDIGIHVYLTIPKPNCFASKEQIEQAIAFASSGKELLLEYQMMLSAYSARKNCQNRQAIIDACAAVELCLDNNISDRLDKLALNPKPFLDKFRGLGDKFDLIKLLDKTFPSDDHQKKIVDPRNGIAHNRNAYPDDKTTDTLISCVENCLAHLFKGYY